MDENLDTSRKTMKNFWSKYSSKCDDTDMILYYGDDAQICSDEDFNEIWKMLPRLDGKNVLELGAGIGRFTGKIASSCSSVTAVDFMEDFIAKNKANNLKYSNIQYICKNVLDLEFKDKEFDFIFSNWLLIFLTENEINKLLQSASNWLKPGGVFFARESTAVNKNFKDYNPALYRSNSQYKSIFEKNNLKVIFEKQPRSYEKHTDREGSQTAWLLQKL